MWFNKEIKIDHTPFCFKDVSEKNINFITQLYKPDGKLKQWENVKQEFNLNDSAFYKWVQIVHAIPNTWKNIISNESLSNNNVYTNHHLIWNNRILCLEKLSAKELYALINYNKNHQPTSQKYFENMFAVSALDWKVIYILPRQVIISTFYRSFQYKLLNNVLYLNKKLFTFGLSASSLCSFCKNEDETITHLFVECCFTVSLWFNIKEFFKEDFALLSLSPQVAILGYLNTDDKTFLIQNIIILLFKYYIYKSRQTGKLDLVGFISLLSKIKNLEKRLTFENQKNLKIFERKWSLIEKRIDKHDILNQAIKNS